MYGLRRLRVDTLQRQGIEPAVYEQIEVKSMKESQPVSKDVVSTLIGKLGLSLEEALMRLMG